MGGHVTGSRPGVIPGSRPEATYTEAGITSSGPDAALPVTDLVQQSEFQERLSRKRFSAERGTSSESGSRPGDDIHPSRSKLVGVEARD
ncbi:unnamed protein product [Toxocara canis]|uniref:Uncharacterized protein n=1 Tax=Toxocara canis TaxID=6265 RepID=A0A183UAI1_TOXCA|nr:unnamed protein product [Toxocara canis]